MAEKKFEEPGKELAKTLKKLKISGILPGTFPGGILVEKSNCCGAPIMENRGGIITQICSKCGKAHQNIIIG